ncbi:reverse transcriptase domain-containing protein [Tanacetum coccineum]
MLLFNSLLSTTLLSRVPTAYDLGESIRWAIWSDSHRHIADFLEINYLFQYGEHQEEAVKLRTFPFSLSGEAKTWLNELNQGTITTWNEMREAFISRYFSPAKFKRLLNEIHSFHQLDHETFVEAWLRLKEMLRTCYGHGLTKGTIIQIFYHGLDDPTQAILDAGGIFLYKTPNEAFKILEDKVLLKLDFSKSSQNNPNPKIVVFAGGSNVTSDHEILMEKLETLVTKIDTEFMNIRGELKDIRNGCINDGGHYASQIYMSDDTLMCGPMEASYVQHKGYHGGYYDQNSYSHSFPNHDYPQYFSALSKYFKMPKTKEMMGEWMASQIKANEHMKNQVVELESQTNQGLRNHQAMIEDLERQFGYFNEKVRRTKSLSRTTNAKPTHEFVYKPPLNRNENEKGDVLFIKEDEIEPIPTMPNPSPIISNSPTVSPFLKDCTVHIPYTQENVFEHDEISNHVGEKDLKSFGGIGNEVSKGKMENLVKPKGPNVSLSLVEYIPKISYTQRLKS